MAVLAAALLIVAWTCRRQGETLAKLALRKPYWVIEVDERGVRNIAKLDNPVAEAKTAKPRDQPAGFGEEDDPLPSMYDDEPIEIGERHA